MRSITATKQNRNLLQKRTSDFWEKKRRARALELFHRAARDVPAYRDFLRENQILPAKVRTWKDFQLVPPVDKKNYLRQYPFQKLVWPGVPHSHLVWTATSGSTGKPFYFPRNEVLDRQYADTLRLFLDHSSHGAGKPTLVIVGFGMGVWIGGLITYQGYQIAAREGGYPVSILTPGINKKEIFGALRELAPHFSETILVGYAPFVKDILDSARAEGIDLKKINLRLHFAAEAFTENFRDYLAKVGHIGNVCRDTMNIYGSADIGAMAFETPVAILARRLVNADRSRAAFKAVFGDISKTPTLAQYDPRSIVFEAHEGELLLTGDNVMPLVRYAIGDHGGVMSYPELEQRLATCGINFEHEITVHRLRDCRYELPFVFIYERTDLSTTLYGLQVYPEHVREALIAAPVNRFVTGKFTMKTEFDKHENQYLEINIETLPGAKIGPTTSAVIVKAVTENLDRVNSEFRELHRFIGDRALPRVVFWPAEDPKYFRPGVKQKWTL